MNNIKNLNTLMGLISILYPIFLSVNEIFIGEPELSSIRFFSIFAGCGLLYVSTRWEEFFHEIY